MENEKRYQILYVEDAVQLAELCQASMEMHDIGMMLAENCAIAEELFAKNTYDLALLDYNLPDGDGLGLARKFQSSAPDTPLVLITAQGSEKVAAEALELGVSAYVIKSGKDIYTSVLPNVVKKAISNAEAKVEARELQLKLKSNEANLNAFLNAVNDRAVLIEADGEAVIANKAFSSMIGMSVDELVGKNLFDIECLPTLEQHRDEVKKIIATGEPISGEAKIVDLTGTYMESSAYPVFDDKGNPVRVAFLMRDVTSRVEMENSIRESEERFRDFAKLGADRFWETDADLRFTYFSPPVKNLILPVEKIIGRTFDELPVAGDSNSDFDGILKLLETRHAIDGVLQELINYKGDQVYFSVSGIPLYNDEGEFIGYRGTVKDRTDEVQLTLRAESVEQQFIETLENSEMGLAFWDPDERLSYFNSQYAEINSLMADFIEVGIQFDELVKKRATIKPYPADESSLDIWAENLLKNFREGGEPQEFRRNHAFYEIRAQKFIDGSTMLYLTDITEKKQDEEKLRQAHKMEAIGQLTGGIAHDFNNILAVLLGNLSLIEDDPNDVEGLSQRLARAKTAVMRGSDLTKRLLAFSRKQHLNSIPVNVHALISDLLSMMQRTLGENIVINLHTSSNLDLAMVDVNQLENAILNLVINARDAMPDGGSVLITTFTHYHDGQKDKTIGDMTIGNYVAISVADNGYGMSNEVQQSIFDPFFTTKDFGQGSGLGLSMVYGFLTQSGGGVEVESSKDEGTRLTLYLPVAENQESAAPKKMNNMPNFDQADFDGEGTTIMVIEDDVDVRDVVVSALENIGFDVVDGGDGAGAVDIAVSYPNNIDLLLSDIMLPNGNRGTLLAHEIGQKVANLKVLLMTGYAQENLLSQDDKAADYAFIQKPFQINQLMSKIHGLIN